MDAEEEAQSLPAVIGGRVAEVRRSYGWSQEQLAQELALKFGMDATRSVVAAIEAGNRRIDLGSLIALSIALNVALPEWFAGEGRVEVLPGTTTTRRALRAMFGSQADQTTDSADDWSIFGLRWAEAHEKQIGDALSQLALRHVLSDTEDVAPKDPQQAAIDANSELEQRAARKFGLDPLEVSILAHARYGHGLTTEREDRVERRARGDTDPEKLRRLRSSVARGLLEDLQAFMEERGAHLGEESDDGR